MKAKYRHSLQFFVALTRQGRPDLAALNAAVDGRWLCISHKLADFPPEMHGAWSGAGTALIRGEVEGITAVSEWDNKTRSYTRGDTENMNTLSVSTLSLEGELFAQLAAGNSAGTKIILRIRMEQLFEDEGQLLVDKVFGSVLANLIRGEGRYKNLEYEHREKVSGLIQFGDELETF